MHREILSFLIFLLASWGLPLLVSSCGFLNIDPGSTSSVFPRDPRPSGEPVVQGQLSGLNSQTVTGSALVFSSGPNYIVRLEGITVPSETGLKLQVFGTPGGMVLNVPLRAINGTQNYRFTPSAANITFDNVYIFSTMRNLNYGSARLF